MENNTKEMEETITKCFKDIPFVKVDILRDFCATPFYKPDLVLEVKNDSILDRLLVIEYKDNGQPRMARSAVNQLLRYANDVPRIYPIFAAPYISSRSAEICREQGVGYIDLAGNCRLVFDNIYILKEGQENPYSFKRDLRSLFSPKAERIIRVLLNHPNKKWKTEELAKTAEVSLGQVYNVKKLLLDREWLDPADFRLVEPRQLLKEWSVAYRSQRNRKIDCYSFEKVNELELLIAETCDDMGINYALTGFSAAARRVPMVRYQRATIYIDINAERVIEHLNIKKVGTGANLSIWMPYDCGVFYGIEVVEGINMVSPIQNFLDLKGDRGRGEEAATALLEGVISKQW